MESLKFEEEWVDRSCIKPGMTIKVEEGGDVKYTVVLSTDSCKTGKHGSAKTIVESRDLVSNNKRTTIYKASDKPIVIKPIKHIESVAFFDGNDLTIMVNGECKPIDVSNSMEESDKQKILETMDNNPDCENFECVFRSLPNYIRLESIKPK